MRSSGPVTQARPNPPQLRYTWKRFERRWSTWLTNPWKSMFPWGYAIAFPDHDPIFWVNGRRHTDKQHARYILKMQFDPDVQGQPEGGISHPSGPRRPYRHAAGRQAKI